MDTAIQALLKAMLLHGWFTKSDGNQNDCPVGYFGYTDIQVNELREIREAFFDTIHHYGLPQREGIVGYWFATINSDGVLSYFRKDTLAEAIKQFEDYQAEYSYWTQDVM